MGVFLVVATATIFKCHWLCIISVAPRIISHIDLLWGQGVCNVADNLAREAVSAIGVDEREGDGVGSMSSHSPVAPIPARYVNIGRS